MKDPRVTVVIPVYNRQDYIESSIKSILNQTYTDFELLVINDKSSDNTAIIVQDLIKQDSRIKLLDNVNQKGIVGGLNTGIANARGEYIVRMDDDDFSLPTRIEKQVKFMDENPKIGVCGTWVKLFGSVNNIVWKLATSSDLIKVTMLFYGALAHPAVIIRKKILTDNNQFYDYSFQWTEDYDLWTRLSKFTDFANIPEILLKYRTHSKNVTTTHSDIQLTNSRKIRIRQLNDLGIIPIDEESEIHDKISNSNFDRDNSDFLKKSVSWFNKILLNNSKVSRYNQKVLANFLVNKTLEIYKTSNYFSVKFSLGYLFRNLPVELDYISKIRIIVMWGLYTIKKIILKFTKRL